MAVVVDVVFEICEEGDKFLDEFVVVFGVAQIVFVVAIIEVESLFFTFFGDEAFFVEHGAIRRRGDNEIYFREVEFFP